MQLLRRGDRGPAVAEVRSTLRRLRPAAADTAAARRTIVRRRRRARGPRLPAAARADHRRHRRPGHLPRAARGRLDARRPDAGLPDVRPDDRRRRASRCRSGCSSSATTPAAPTACSASRPRPRCASFQRDYGLIADGMCGPATLRSLRQLGRKVTGGRPHLLREQELLRQAGPRLRGKRIVDRPRARRRRTAASWSAGVAEADLMWDLARRLGRPDGGHRHGRDALPAGARPCPTEAERAGFANDAGADLVLSLHTDANRSMHAQGVATLPLRHRLGRHVDRRRDARRLHPARAGRPHRACSTAAPSPAPGTCCGSPACPPCGSRSAT